MCEYVHICVACAHECRYPQRPEASDEVLKAELSGGLELLGVSAGN